jgi:methylmalonyl-CoA mutase N-terminal domain/subunit
VAQQAWRHEQGLQDGSIPKVGVNRYRMEEEAREVELHTYNPRQAEESVRRLEETRATRDPQAVGRALEAVRGSAASGANVMPSMMEAARSYASLGEITRVLREVFGEFQEPVSL